MEAIGEVGIQPLSKIAIALMQIVGGLAQQLGVKFPAAFTTFVASMASAVRFDVTSLLSIGDLGANISIGCMSTGKYYGSLVFNILLVVTVCCGELLHTSFEVSKVKKGDKKMTEEENREKVQAIFSHFDKDGDGVELEEVKMIAEKIDPDVTDEAVLQLFADAGKGTAYLLCFRSCYVLRPMTLLVVSDTDGSGVIDFEEFYGAVTAPRPKVQEGEKRGFDLRVLVKRSQILQIKANASGRLFLLVFLLYPGLTSKIFQGIACRQLGEGQSVLLADYDVSCDSPSWYAFVVFVVPSLVVWWPFGLPLFLFMRMFKVRAKLEAEDEDTVKEYDFVVGDYKPTHWSVCNTVDNHQTILSTRSKCFANLLTLSGWFGFGRYWECVGETLPLPCISTVSRLRIVPLPCVSDRALPQTHAVGHDWHHRPRHRRPDRDRHTDLVLLLRAQLPRVSVQKKCAEPSQDLLGVPAILHLAGLYDDPSQLG